MAEERNFSEKYREFLLESRRLVLAENIPSEEYKSRLDNLRTGFMMYASGAASSDRSAWVEENQQEWGRALGEIRKLAIQGKFLIVNEDRGDDIVEKLIGYNEAKRIRAISILERNTGLKINAFSQAALRPAYEKALEIVKNSSSSEKSEEEEFLAGLNSEMTLTGAVKIIGLWLKGRSENSTPDATAEALKKAKAEEMAAFLEPAPPNPPDPRVELTTQIAALYAEAETLRSKGDRKVARGREEEAEALEQELAVLESQPATVPVADPRVELTTQIAALYAEAETLRSKGDRKVARGREEEAEALEQELAVLESQPAPPPPPLDNFLAAAITACESVPKESRLRVILSAYRAGAYEEDEGGADAAFVRRVTNIQKKK